MNMNESPDVRDFEDPNDSSWNYRRMLEERRVVRANRDRELNGEPVNENRGPWGLREQRARERARENADPHPDLNDHPHPNRERNTGENRGIVPGSNLDTNMLRTLEELARDNGIPVPPELIEGAGPAVLRALNLEPNLGRGTYRHVMHLPNGEYYNPLDSQSVGDLNRRLWIARIDGLDPRYDYKREFVGKRYNRESRTFTLMLEYDKIYEERNYNLRRFFTIPKTGEIVDLSDSHVRNHFGSSIKKIIKKKLTRYGFISRGITRDASKFKYGVWRLRSALVELVYKKVYREGHPIKEKVIGYGRRLVKR